ncbi:hypothetical protein GUJ93_ZPchr0792g7099 [Zizania palustris]|uniref:Uncharacterized protein n=1 Tax=Zizania palustris TaxID=103762 RepID=A0A8J5QS16_ZIZPA|nr:hypothetical protein GUJ93_ZPchr0792g7099 [Zizania palustris]
MCSATDLLSTSAFGRHGEAGGGQRARWGGTGRYRDGWEAGGGQRVRWGGAGRCGGDGREARRQAAGEAGGLEVRRWAVSKGRRGVEAVTKRRGGGDQEVRRSGKEVGRRGGGRRTKKPRRT